MMTFRKADVNDIHKRTELVNSAYRGEGSIVGWTTEADLLGGQRTDPDKIAEMISASDSQIELAIEKGELQGCIYIKKEDEYVYFGMLTVRPNLQNKGAGKLLLSRLEDLTREWGYQKIRMTVISQREELISRVKLSPFQKMILVLVYPKRSSSFMFLKKFFSEKLK